MNWIDGGPADKPLPPFPLAVDPEVGEGWEQPRPDAGSATPAAGSATPAAGSDTRVEPSVIIAGELMQPIDESAPSATHAEAVLRAGATSPMGSATPVGWDQTVDWERPVSANVAFPSPAIPGNPVVSVQPVQPVVSVQHDPLWGAQTVIDLPAVLPPPMLPSGPRATIPPPRLAEPYQSMSLPTQPTVMRAVKVLAATAAVATALGVWMVTREPTRSEVREPVVMPLPASASASPFVPAHAAAPVATTVAAAPTLAPEPAAPTVVPAAAAEAAPAVGTPAADPTMLPSDAPAAPANGVDVVRVGDGDCTVQVESTPVGAVVLYRGRAVAQTPADLNGLPCGEPAKVTLSHARFEPLDRTVTPRADRIVQIDGKLRRQTTSMVVASSPPGAIIRVDGEEVGMTPAVLPAVPGKKVTVEILLAGYEPYKTTVVSRIGATYQLSTALRLKSDQPPR